MQETTQQSDTGIDTIAAWLRERVASYVRKRPQDIALDVDLAQYGLDSLYALTLSGDIEERFGLAVESTVLWDYPSIAGLAGHLRDELSRRAT